MTLVAVIALGLGVLLVISAFENVSLVQVWQDIQAGKPLYTDQTASSSGQQTQSINPFNPSGGSSGTGAYSPGGGGTTH